LKYPLLVSESDAALGRAQLFIAGTDERSGEPLVEELFGFIAQRPRNPRRGGGGQLHLNMKRYL
jgi:hypothetical protein